MQGKILTPFKSGQIFESHQTMKLTRQQLRQHKYVLSIRQAAEWGMRALQGSFGRLRTPLPSNDAHRARIISVCIHLHNLRTVRIGINQIKTVFNRAWADPDGQVYGGCSGGDRISRFYNIDTSV